MFLEQRVVDSAANKPEDMFCVQRIGDESEATKPEDMFLEDRTLGSEAKKPTDMPEERILDGGAFQDSSEASKPDVVEIVSSQDVSDNLGG